MDSGKPLDVLARNSLDPETALNNGKPTILEFYADWCEVCQEMAPSMIKFKEKYEDKIDIVMLNVDNERWLDLIEKYQVRGIPQLSLFDQDGFNKFNLVGLKKESEFEKIADFLLGKISILNSPSISDIENSDAPIYPLNKSKNIKSILPMTHG